MSHKNVIFIQARMSSRRLAGKVLLNLKDKPVLKWVVDRCKRSRLTNDVVVLTSTDLTDDVIHEYCKQEGILCFRGPLDNVLERFYKAADYYNVDSFVRITADCPLIDPTIIDNVIMHGIANDLDYSGLSGAFPDGLDCTFFSQKAITESNINASKAYQKEHIGQFVEEHISDFSSGQVTIFEKHSHLRLTLDQPEDFVFLTKLLEHFSDDTFSALDIIEVLRNNSELLDINSNIVRNEGLIRSMEKS